MTILLADDERMVRLGLISMLNELYPGEHRYIEAKNGAELVAMVADLQPEVAFVDIKMPLMDGLTAMEQAREHSPCTSWLILTGYAEFDYARQAMQSGVQEYLLKPVALEELQAAMERVTHKARHATCQKNKTFGFDMVQAYNLYQLCGEVDDNLTGPYAIHVFYIDHWDADTEQRHHRALHKQAENLCEGAAKAHTLFYLNSGELCTLALEQDSSTVCRRLETLVGSQSACVTVAQAHAADLAGIFRALDRIQALSALRSVRGFSDICTLDELEAWAQLPHLLATGKLLETMTQAWRQRDGLAYKKTLEALHHEPHATVINASDCTAAGYAHCAVGLCPEAGYTGYNGLLEALQHAGRCMHQVRGSGDDFTSRVQRYVEAHYMEQIGIDSVARILDLTPSYVSRLFHQKTGRKFIDYLTEVRMENAKRILADHTVQQTATAVGYLSTRHFTKLFSRFAGMLPSEYQRTLKPHGPTN